MFKQTLLLLALLLFSGCAERGYKLTVNNATDTITAETSIDIGNTGIQTKNELHKMQDAIQKTRKKKRIKKNKIKYADDTITEQIVKKHQLEKEKALQKEKILQAREAKELTVLKTKDKVTNKAKTLENKMLQEKNTQEAKHLLSLENKKKQQAQTTIEAKKLTDAKKELVLKKVETTRNAKYEEKIIEEEKTQKEKILKLQKERAHQLESAKKEKINITATQPLIFRLINKIYHKFGSSEVHGHVIYLDSHGQEIRLAGAKVYILPVSATLNNWYRNYYLKNKNNPKSNGIVANYLNSTYLNLEKNFEFYGVAEGSYYIIIEAKYPTYIAKDTKVYIAKKIQVGKNKKIMAVFSKKL